MGGNNDGSYIIDIIYHVQVSVDWLAGPEGCLLSRAGLNKEDDKASSTLSKRRGDPPSVSSTLLPV